MPPDSAFMRRDNAVGKLAAAEHRFGGDRCISAYRANEKAIDKGLYTPIEPEELKGDLHGDVGYAARLGNDPRPQRFGRTRLKGHPVLEAGRPELTHVNIAPRRAAHERDWHNVDSAALRLYPQPGVERAIREKVARPKGLVKRLVDEILHD